MMWKKMLILSLLVGLFACKNEPKQSVESEDIQEFRDEHNAQISLDYTGIYEGEIPCADCSSIRFKIAINQDNSFQAKFIYVGKSDEVFQEEGYYKWLEDGNTIKAKSDTSDSTYHFQVRENELMMLNQSGKEIESHLKEKYILTKTG